MVNLNRLVAVMYVLEQTNYSGWFGLDLFPYRDEPEKFITMSRDNLRFALNVAKMMKEKGAQDRRVSGKFGPEMAQLMLECIRKA